HAGEYRTRGRHEHWAARDPIPAYAARLEAAGLIDASTVEDWKREVEEIVESQAKLVVEADWPSVDGVGVGVLEGEPARVRIDVLDPERFGAREPRLTPGLEPFGPFDRKGQTFLEGGVLCGGDAHRNATRA